MERPDDVRRPLVAEQYDRDRRASHRAERSTRPQSAGRDADVNPTWNLIALLNAFKDARQRRDELPYGSSAWDAADDDIQQLQREIFDLSFDDALESIAAYGRRRADRRARPEVDADPDSELGEPEGPAAI